MHSRDLILIVEDNKALRESLRDILELLDYKVIEADSAESALRWFERKASAIRLMISDIMLPGQQNGEALFYHLTQARPKVQVILMTGHDLQDKRDQLLQAGAAGCVEKPFSIDEMISMVQRAMEG